MKERNPELKLQMLKKFSVEGEDRFGKAEELMAGIPAKPVETKKPKKKSPKKKKIEEPVEEVIEEETIVEASEPVMEDPEVMEYPEETE